MIEDLKDKSKDVALALATIKTFTFDDLSEAINQPDNEYRMLHMTNPLESSVPDNNKPYHDYPIEFFVYDLDKEQNSDKELTSDQRVALWSEQELVGHKFIKELTKVPNVAHLTDNVINMMRGRLAHTDVLIGVRFTFNLRFFECRNP